jgi:S-adenosylmethionine hydrolase
MGSTLLGNIPVLDVQYGNVWTKIDKKTFDTLNVSTDEELLVRIFRDEDLVYEGKIPYENTFGDVDEGVPLLYLNELLNVSFAINMDSFAEKYGIDSGPEWSAEITKI